MGKKSASGGEQRAKEPLGQHPAPPGGPEAVAPNPTTRPHGHGHHPHIDFKFFEELKHRNVVRVAVLYLLACWLVLDPVHVVFHMLEVPAWANRLVVVLMAVGFPAVLLFAWAFEITPEGLKPTVEVDPKRSIRTLTGRRLDRAIIVVLVLALGYFVADKFWLAKRAAVPESVATAPTAPLPPAAIAVPEKSIAVLPFVDMSEKKDQEYFSDGLTGELIDRLSHSPELKVIARTSSFSFKGRNEDARAIASKLGVANLLEGSVRKAGNELRITAQLIRAADGTHLWSQTYDRNLSDIFKVQSEIAGTVAQALKATLNSPGETTQRKETSAEAYNLLLEGNFLSGRRNKADSNRAIEFYKRAVEIDPNYALAWTKMAREYASQAAWGWIPGSQGMEGIEKALEKARELAQHALRLNPDLPEAHRTLGRIYDQFDWDWSAARAQYQRARELEPDGVRSADDLAWLNGGMYGRLDQDIEIERQMIERDPLDTSARSWLGWLLFLAGRYEEAVTAARHAVLLNPSYAGANTSMAYALLYLGRLDEALAAAREEADEPFRLQTLPAAFWALGRKAESDAALNELKTKYANSSAYNIAEMYAYRGEIDSAFQWLDRAYRQRDIGMTWVRVDPLLQNLHKDQRYKAVLVKMKLDGDPPTALH